MGQKQRTNEIYEIFNIAVCITEYCVRDKEHNGFIFDVLRCVGAFAPNKLFLNEVCYN